MVTADDIRMVALSLPRTDEVLVRDQIKFRVGRIVYVALSRDELSTGLGFSKEERAALVATHPEKVGGRSLIGSPEAWRFRYTVMGHRCGR